MTITRLKAAAWYYPQSVLATLGLFWLVIEPIIGLTGESIHLYTVFDALGVAVIGEASGQAIQQADMSIHLS